MYYREDLARIHHEGFGGYADSCAPGLLDLLEPNVDVLEIGCGSGALTKHLLAPGHAVLATDASEAMVELAETTVPQAEILQLTLPNDDIPPSSAIVSVGHAVNYLASADEIQRAISALANALEPDGLLVLDICDLTYGDTRQGVNHASVEGDGWSMAVTTIFEPPARFVRGMTTTTALEDGSTRQDHETHINVLVDVNAVAESLRNEGFDVCIGRSLGDYTLPDGMYVLTVRN